MSGRTLMAQLAVVLAAVLAWCAPALGQVAGEATRGARELVIGLPEPSHVRGFLRWGGAGELDGFAVRVAREAAEAAGYSPRFVYMDGEDPLQALASGRVDLMSPVGVSNVRLQNLEFTIPLAVTRGMVVARQGTAQAASAEQMRGMRVVVAGNGAGHEWCLSNGIACEATTLQDALRAVAEGKADYLVTTTLAGAWEIERMGLKGLATWELDDRSLWRSFAIAAAPDRPDLVADMNRGLRVLMDSGRFDALYDETIGRYQARVAKTSLPVSPVLGLGVWVIAASVVGLALRRMPREQNAAAVADAGTEGTFGVFARAPLWARLVLVAVGVAGLCEVTRHLAMGAMKVYVAWPAAGLALGVVLLATGTRRAWMYAGAAAAGRLAWELWYSDLGVWREWTDAAMFSGVMGLMAMLARWVVLVLGGHGRGLGTTGGALALSVSALVSPAAAALVLYLLSHAAEGRAPKFDALSLWAWGMRGFGETLGMLMVAPAVLRAKGWSVGGWTGRRGLELLGFFSLVVGAGLWIFRLPAPTGGEALAAVVLCVLLTLVLAMRIGPGAVGMSVLVHMLIAVDATNGRSGPFVALSAAGLDRLLAVQAFFGIVSIAGLTLAGTILAQRGVEKELREGRARFRAMTENMPGLVYTYFVAKDGTRSARYLSPRFDAWLADFPGLDLIGDFRRTILPSIHLEDRERFTRAVLAARAGPAVFDLEYRMVDVHGRMRWVHSIVVPIPEATGVLWQGLLLEVTDLRSMQDALLQAQERLREAVRGAGVGTWRLDIATGILDADESLWRLFDRPARGPTPAKELEAHMHPEDRERVLAAMGAAMRGEKDYRAEYRLVRPDGSVRWLSSRGTVHRDEEGRPAWVAGACTDVTDAKQAAEEREKLENQLRHAQRLESLGIMAGGIAHDFNNLLVAVLGNAGLALRHVDAHSEAARILREIEQAARQAAELTSQLLAYAGKAEPRFRAVDLTALVSETVQMTGRGVLRGSTAEFDLREGLPRVWGDPTQLKQVLVNLISNAAEAMAEKPGKISVRTGRCYADRAMLEGTFLRSDAREGEYVYLEIEDTGPGIAENVLTRVFDPFFTTKFTGRGLGLAVVQGVVQRHGGAVKVTSKVGEGTLFRILLPTAAKNAGGEETAPTAAAGPTVTGSVLVVDDEPMVRNVARRLLESAGWRAHAAESGEHALALVRGGAAFDAALVDITMPGMSGCELLEKLRVESPRTAVVLTSGYSQESGDKPEDVPFVQKPYTAEVLLHAMSSAMARANGHGPGRRAGAEQNARA